MSEQTLSNLSREERRFEPPADLAADANVKEEAYARAEEDHRIQPRDRHAQHRPPECRERVRPRDPQAKPYLR